jgi:hypothetical protein
MWTEATTRSAYGGSIARVVTMATAFSFQSVMTSAETGLARPVRMIIGTTQRKLDNMAILLREQGRRING